MSVLPTHKKTKAKTAANSARLERNPDLAQSQSIVEEESHNFRIDAAPITSSNNSKEAKKASILTVFHVRESQIDVNKRITAAQRAYQVNPTALYADPKMYNKVIPIPLRPAWNNRMSREQVQSNEEERFNKYLEVIYKAIPPQRLNHFEHNLDVWRQLWRTSELSDVIVICVDARHPQFHFPPSLYDFVVKKMGKPCVVVFNKIDLVPQRVLNEWHDYFKTTFPGVNVVFFTSHPREGTITFDDADQSKLLKPVAGLNDKKMNQNKYKKTGPVGVAQLLEKVREVVKARRLLEQGEEGDNGSTNNNDNSNDSNDSKDDDDDDDDDEVKEKGNTKSPEHENNNSDNVDNNDNNDNNDDDDDDDDDNDNDDDTDKTKSTSPKNKNKNKNKNINRMITVGMVGHPNAGKSSLINAILGRVAVSVSAMPGHTKHLQTMQAPSYCSDIQLCDCPGLVFPAVDMPRPLQVLLGIFPLASLREPYSCVNYLAERLPLVDMYNLKPYLGDDGDASVVGPERPLLNLMEYIKSQKERERRKQEERGGIVDDSPLVISVNEVQGVHVIDCDDDSTTSSSSSSSSSSSVSGSNSNRNDVKGKGIKGQNKKGKGKGGKAGGDDDGADDDDLFKTMNEELKRDSVIRKTGLGASPSPSSPSPAGTPVGSSGSGSSSDVGTRINSDANTIRTVLGGEGKFVWSAWRICESLAHKNKWREDAGRVDTLRAGMQIVKDCLEGRIALYFKPPPRQS